MNIYPQQTVLDVALHVSATFANFVVSEDNLYAVTMLRELAAGTASTSSIYLWGEVGAGKTHLLKALGAECKRRALYVALGDHAHCFTEVLTDLSQVDLVCLDDLHLIAANKTWEETVFHCFNQCIEQHKKIVISAQMAPQFLPLQLADLKSRMMGGLICYLHQLSENQLITALKSEAKARGFELDDAVINYLLRRYERSARALFNLLNSLDQAMLVAQRRLTIPFVKDILKRFSKSS